MGTICEDEHTVIPALITCAGRVSVRPGAGNEEQRIVDLLLTWLRAEGSVKARGRQRRDWTPVLATIRSRNRVEGVETVRATVNALAVVAPERLAGQRQEGVERDEPRVEENRLREPGCGREADALVSGKEGSNVRKAIDAPSVPW